ncbi:MAG: O-antigen ligase family protein [Betaproteobacteria bacterium]|nr:O-antigen ligase family protein [Betaproteobacteria bacterium]
MSIFYQRAFWLNLAGACAVAIVAAVPILMSNAMQRGFTIAKQSVAEPLAVLAFGAVLLGVGWKWLATQEAAMKIAVGSLAVFLLLAVISTVLAESPEVAIFGSFYRREGLLAWAAYGAFFYAVLGWAHRAGAIESFVDVLLLSSIVAAAYALQQRMDLDFYPVGARDFTRPSSTLGNPLFLAAYLAMLLPITVARCWQARGAWRELAPWLAVAILQLCGLLVTQSRGPLLAAMPGMLLFAAICAAHAQARRVFVLAFVLFAAIAASIVAINTLPAARHWAQDVPVAARLVFDLDRAAGEQTQRASRSAASRPAVWEAGVATYAAAPLANKLLGYGPDSAAVHYLPHVPVLLVRLIGYGQSNTFDRLHADTLEISLNFGLLAWLVYCLFFSAVMYFAARALWGLSGSAPPWIFFAFMCGGGLSAGAFAVQAGFAAAAAPAMGLGIGAGWFLFMLGCAWRCLGHRVQAMPAAQAGRWVLLAGLTSALWIFWMDAQISIAVPTTRYISCGVAALVLVLADRLVRGAAIGAGADAVPARSLRTWGIACILVAACASCLPIILFDAGADVAEVHWLRRVLPLLPLLVVAAWVEWAHARRDGDCGHGSARAWLAIALGLPLIYTAAHLALMIRPGAELNANHVLIVSAVSYAGALVIFAMCIAFAWVAARGAAPAADAPVIAPAARWSIWALAAGALLVAVADWHARQADVAATLAAQIADKRPQAGEQLIEEAIRLQPHERQFRRQLVFERLDRAVTGMRKIEEAKERPADAPDRIRAIVRNVAAAETAAREAALLFPRDPWMVVALANVLQIKALRVLRPLDPEGGARAAAEAGQLFERAHRMFPSEPLVLRNWAQLLADQGNLPQAYRLFDLMEQLIPSDPEPYAARLVVARQAYDNNTISDTLSRARGALDAADFSQLSSVANLQRK